MRNLLNAIPSPDALLFFLETDPSPRRSFAMSTSAAQGEHPRSWWNPRHWLPLAQLPCFSFGLEFCPADAENKCSSDPGTDYSNSCDDEIEGAQ
jgi:hypothetical protein